MDFLLVPRLDVFWFAASEQVDVVGLFWGVTKAGVWSLN
jgi:hypothetical protein